MTRLPVLVRQNKVFEYVTQGLTYEQIGKKLKMSEDTIARDMQAIAEQVQQLIRERNNEVLAFALAQYGEVIQNAWKEYHAEARRERDLFEGKLDYPVTIVTTKTLQIATPELPLRGKDAGEDEDDEDELGSIGDFIDSLSGDDTPESRSDGPEISLPLEVRTKTGTVRPGWRSNRAQWLKLIVESTREITELTGIKTLLIKQTSDPVEHVHMSLDQWKAEQQRRRTEAEATYRLLEDNDA